MWLHCTVFLIGTFWLPFSVLQGGSTTDSCVVDQLLGSFASSKFQKNTEPSIKLFALYWGPFVQLYCCNLTSVLSRIVPSKTSLFPSSFLYYAYLERNHMQKQRVEMMWNVPGVFFLSPPSLVALLLIKHLFLGSDQSQRLFMAVFFNFPDDSERNLQ